MKLFFRLFLLFNFYLLGGYNCVYASYSDYVRNAPAKTFQKSLAIGREHIIDDLAIDARYFPPSTKSEKIKFICEDDNDNVEITLLKKQAAANNYFTTFFTQPAEDICYYIKKRLPLCEHLAYFSACKYIFLQVIRI